MNYLLDTCVISDFIKGQAGVVNKLLSVPPSAIAVSSVSLMEVEYGLKINPIRARKIASGLRSFFDAVTAVPFSEEDAFATAMIRGDLKKAGTIIGPYDLLIAGTALNRGLVLVTSNTREFNRVRNLKIEDWRS